VVSDAFMFADDTKIFRTISDESDIDIIQKDLDELFNWSKLWLLKFHPDKCKVLPVIRMHLEYASSVSCPYRKADILCVENVRKRATKMLPSFKNMNYEERLIELKLPTLRFRRL